MRLDDYDLTRHERRATALALAVLPYATASAIPWFWETTAEPNPLLDVPSLALFWLVLRGAAWARWVAAAIAALRGVSALGTAMLWRTGDVALPAIGIQAAVGISMLFSASVLFASSALDEPGESQSLMLKHLPWAECVLRSSAAAPEDIPAPIVVSPPRRGGQLTAWLIGTLGVASWLVPASLCAVLMSSPMPLDPDVGGLSNQITIMGIIAGLGFTFGAYVTSLWFPLGALLVLPVALRWRHPAKLLVLRPFNRAQLTRNLVRIIRSEVAPLGHCYTLADAAIHVSRWLRAPLILGQLTTMGFRHRTIAKPGDLERLTWRMRTTWLRNMNWLASRRKVFPVTCVHEAWRPCLMRLVSETDAIVVDVSGLGGGMRWELELLAQTGHAQRAVFLVHEDFELAVRRELAELPLAASSALIIYGANGLHQPGALRRSILDVLSQSRSSWQVERLALGKFLARDQASPARPAPPPRGLPWRVRGAIGLAVVSAAAVVALVGWAKPGLPPPDDPVQVDAQRLSTAHRLSDLASRLLQQSGSERVAAALAAESLARVPTPQADLALRAALHALNCRSEPGPGREWVAELPASARLVASSGSGRWLAGEVAGDFFAIDTSLQLARRLPWTLEADAVLLDLAVSDDGERFATLTAEREASAPTPTARLGDTVRVRSKNGDVVWSRESLGPLIGLGFVRDSLWVVTHPQDVSRCFDVGPVDTRSCGAVIDAESGKHLAEYRAYVSASRAHLSNDGSVMTVSSASTLDILRTTDGVRIGRIPGCSGGVSALSADNQRVACVDASLNGATIWFAKLDAPAGTPTASVTASAPVLSLLLDEHGSNLFATLGDGSLAAWDLSTRRLTTRLSFPGARDVVFDAGRAAVVVSSKTGLSSIPVRPRDLIDKACKACDVMISEASFLAQSGGEPGRTCAVKR